MQPRLNPLSSPFDLSALFIGPPLSEGPLPAFFYFSLSAEESLSLSPYNAPIAPFLEEKVRIFSFTIPAHGPGFDKFKAMDIWADWALSGKDFLSPFFDNAAACIAWACDQAIVDRTRIALGGLSRGGFVASHIAARLPEVKALLGFAPLTTLLTVKEFQEDPSFLHKMEKFDLNAITDKILNTKNIRFYIGNRDLRVGTDACYSFIRNLAEDAHERRIRDASIELYITPSIGHMGHGTAPETFKEGANWAKRLILG